MSNRRGRGGIGRRARFRFLWGKTRGGSIPLARIRLLSYEKILMQKSNLNHRPHGPHRTDGSDGSDGPDGPDGPDGSEGRGGEDPVQVKL